MAFSRDEAKVDLRKITGSEPSTDEDLEMFGQNGVIYDSTIPVDSPLYVEECVLNGYVCFTHFIHLERSGVLCPDLLRYAYRRTAAIVRRGIDWVIPVELADDDDETFVGLCGQDKNRMNDTLESLARETEEANHHKVTAEYFLTSHEQKLFKDKGLSYHGLMSKAANQRLEELRNFVVGVPRAYEENVPLTYGFHRADETLGNVHLADPNETMDIDTD